MNKATLPDMDLDTDSNSKLNGYNCFHCTNSDSDLDGRSLLYPSLGRISVPGLGSESVSGNVNRPLLSRIMLRSCKDCVGQRNGKTIPQESLNGSCNVSMYHSVTANTRVGIMAHFHCRTRIQILTQIRIPNPMAT